MLTRFALLTAVAAIGVASPAWAAQVFASGADANSAVFGRADSGSVDSVAGTNPFASESPAPEQLGAAVSRPGEHTAMPYAAISSSERLLGGSAVFTGGEESLAELAADPAKVAKAANPSGPIPAPTADASAHLPEAATWAMMLLGFSGMGYALRRRGPSKARVRFN